MMREQPLDKFFHVKISKRLELGFNRDPGTRFPLRLNIDKVPMSLDSEEFDWLLACLYFARRRTRQGKYRYRWVTNLPQIMHVSNETRHMLGVLERAFHGNRDLDLSSQP